MGQPDKACRRQWQLRMCAAHAAHVCQVTLSAQAGCRAHRPPLMPSHTGFVPSPCAAPCRAPLQNPLWPQMPAGRRGRHVGTRGAWFTSNVPISVPHAFEPRPFGDDNQTAHAYSMPWHTHQAAGPASAQLTCWGVHQLPWLSGLPASSCWCWGSLPLTTKMVYPCTAGPVAEHCCMSLKQRMQRDV